MNILSVLSLILFPIYVAMGWYVYKLDPKSRVNMIFVLFAFCLSFWAFTFAFFYSAPDKATAWFWYNLSAIGRFFYPAVVLNLALIFTSSRFSQKTWYNSAVFYILPFIFLYAIFTGPFITQDLVFVNGQWYETLITNNIWWYAYTLYYLIYISTSLIIIGWWGYTSNLLRERRQALIVISTALAAIVLGNITNNFFQYFNYHLLPSMAQITGVIFFVGITYAIRRYKLLKFTATAAADQIISKIRDMVILIDTYGNIITINSRAQELLGYRSQELEGLKWEFLLNDGGDMIKMDKIMKRELLADENSRGMEINLNTKSGDYIPVKAFISGVKDDFGIIGMLMVAQDLRQTRKLEHEIREKNIAQKSARANELQLQKSLNEKELLLKEIHHRVKNNMQIISSLLNLQAGYIKDKEAADVLKESQARIVSMAMIHENLYRSDNLTGINFEDYIKHHIRNLFHTYNITQENIEFNVTAPGVFLDIDTAIPCGLIINELVTNSIKHAFPDGVGKITVRIEQEQNEYHLEVSDNGVGLPPDLDITQTQTLGLLLVNSLVGQLDGELEVVWGEGTSFHITFRKVEYPDRI